MTFASTTSPFTAVHEDSPWILWRRKTPVSTLNSPEQTDVRSVFEDQEATAPPEMEEQPFKAATQFVQHNQYNAILARINHASQKTKGFSAWKP